MKVNVKMRDEGQQELMEHLEREKGKRKKREFSNPHLIWAGHKVSR